MFGIINPNGARRCNKVNFRNGMNAITSKSTVKSLVERLARVYDEEGAEAFGCFKTKIKTSIGRKEKYADRYNS